jgi:hypothetical protein
MHKIIWKNQKLPGQIENFLDKSKTSGKNMCSTKSLLVLSKTGPKFLFCAHFLRNVVSCVRALLVVIVQFHISQLPKIKSAVLRICVSRKTDFTQLLNSFGIASKMSEDLGKFLLVVVARSIFLSIDRPFSITFRF